MIWQALSDKPTSYATLKRGYKVAIRMQEVVFQQGKIVIDKNQVNDCGRNFRVRRRLCARKSRHHPPIHSS